MPPTDDEIKWVFGRTGGHCFYCGRKLVLVHYGLPADFGAWEVNYFIPGLKSEEQRLQNSVAACMPCDAMKGKCYPWEYDADRFRKGDDDPVNYIL